MKKIFAPILQLFGLSKPKASIVVVGLHNSGKTSIVQCLHADQDDSSEGLAPTVGFAVDRLVFHRVKLTVFDMSGNKKYHGLWECYFKDAQGIVFVVDSADPGMLPEAKEELDKTVSHTDLMGVPLLLLANKSDLPSSLSEAEIAQRLELAETPDRAWHVAGCSAKTKEGVEEAMRWMLQQAQKVKPRKSPSANK